MNTYIGIDLGTSAVKALLVNENGVILNEKSCSYPLLIPKENYSEQDPNEWFEKTINVIKLLLINQDKSLVKAISFGGQMHGLVMLDKNDLVIRPAFLLTRVILLLQDLLLQNYYGFTVMKKKILIKLIK